MNLIKNVPEYKPFNKCFLIMLTIKHASMVGKNYFLQILALGKFLHILNFSLANTEIVPDLLPDACVPNTDQLSN